MLVDVFLMLVHSWRTILLPFPEYSALPLDEGRKAERLR